MGILWRRELPKSVLRDCDPFVEADHPALADRPEDVEQVGGFAVQEYVVAELNEERNRRVRIDAQGASLITGSTALSALAFAATTLVTTGEGLVLGRLSLWGLGVTFLAFMVAAFCGLQGGGKVHKNQTVPLEQLDEWRRSDAMWFGGRSEASRVHLCHIISYLETIRGFNRGRARWVAGGSVAQTVALLGLSVAVGAILFAEIYPAAKDWWALKPP
jgi:hypothetical protein